MNQSRSETAGFFDVIADKQVYLSFIYLMLSFPLGIFYFVYIATGLSLGIGLIPIFIGIPLLYIFMLTVKYLMRFERKMAAVLLGVNIAERHMKREKGVGTLVRFKDELLDIELWKGLTYLSLKFFLGILIFTMCVSLVCLSLGCIAVPILYYMLEYNPEFTDFYINGIHFDGILTLAGISATPEQEMFILMLLGVFLGIGSLHIFNKTAYIMGGLLKAMSPAEMKE